MKYYTRKQLMRQQLAGGIALIAISILVPTGASFLTAPLGGWLIYSYLKDDLVF